MNHNNLNLGAFGTSNSIDSFQPNDVAEAQLDSAEDALDAEVSTLLLRVIHI